MDETKTNDEGSKRKIMTSRVKEGCGEIEGRDGRTDEGEARITEAQCR